MVDTLMYKDIKLTENLLADVYDVLSFSIRTLYIFCYIYIASKHVSRGELAVPHHFLRMFVSLLDLFSLIEWATIVAHSYYPGYVSP